MQQIMNASDAGGGPSLAPASCESPSAERHDVGVEALTRHQTRGHRHRAVKAKVVKLDRVPQYQLAQERALAEDAESLPRLPKTRGECLEGLRPCPFVSCRHHLYLDVQAYSGNLKLNFPDIEPGDMSESCSLDIADRGGATLEVVGDLMNVTRERLRQMEVRAREHARNALDAGKLEEYVDFDAGEPTEFE